MKMIAMAALAALSLALLTPVAAHASDEQNLVDEARITLDHLRTDKSFGNAPELLRTARAVLIVPNLVKAGFFLGGEGGDGVMLARSGRGTWTDPAFYTLASASFGLQIGIQAAEVVMIVNTDKALTALEADQFKFGAQAGIAVVTLGLGMAVNTTVFSVVNGLLLRSLPVPHAEQITVLAMKQPGAEGFQSFSYPDFEDYRAGAKSLQGTAIGLAASLAVNRLLTSVLVQVHPPTRSRWP